MTKRSEKALGILWLFFCMALPLLHMLLSRGSYIDADMSSEFLLARLLAEEGGILSKNWLYSTELRVLNTQLVFAAFFRLSDNWFLVRVLSTLLLWGILLGSYGFMLRAMGLGRWFCLTAAPLFLPFSWDQSRVLILGLYYIPHVSISFITLGLMVSLHKGRNALWVYPLSCLLALASGLGGIRQLAILYIPLCMATFLSALLRREKQEWQQFLLSVVLLAFSALGYWGNQLLREQYHFHNYDTLSFRFDLSGLQYLPDGLLRWFGSIGAFSAVSVWIAAAALCLLLTVLLLLLLRQKKLGSSQLLIPLFFLSGLAALTGIYCLTDMEYAPRYYLPVLVFLFPLLAMAWEHHNGRWAAAFLIGCLGINSFSTAAVYRQAPDSSGHREIAEMLVQEGYTQGYASFEHSNVLTEYSNGKIETWTFLKDPHYMHEWLQDARHLSTLPEGKIFLLLSGDEGPTPNRAPFYETDELSLYGFEDQADWIRYLYSWHNSFEGESTYLINGYDREGSRYLPPNGISHGPYITLVPGQYSVHIRGDGLLQAAFDVCKDGSEIIAPLDIREHSYSDIVYTFDLDQKAENVEFRIYNYSSDTFSLQDISVDFLAPG